MASVSPLTTHAAERFFAQTDSVPDQPRWVGQQVLFSVVLAMDERPQGSPRFTFPDAPGGPLLEVSGRPSYDSLNKDGVDYTTWRYDFAFYPQRSGRHTIPPITSRISLPVGDGTWKSFTAETPAFTLETKRPAGAENLAALVSTGRFDATETWQPENPSPKVGDAVTRTITRSADDILGLGFPPLGSGEIDGVSVYPDPPEISDQTYRGVIKGDRADQVVYTFDREGDVTIPGHVIPWFDLTDETLKVVRFPARTFTIAPNPALLVRAETQPARAPLPWPWIGGGVLALSALVFATIRFAVPAIARRRRRFATSERAAFNHLSRACQKGDARAVVTHRRAWLRRLHGRPTLEQFLEAADNAALTEQTARLNRSLYASSADQSWDPQTLLVALVQARKELLGNHQLSPTNHQLVPLNPN